MLAGSSLAVACSPVATAQAKSSASAAAAVRTLAQGPVQQLPGDKVFVDILDFRQTPGAAFGPHAHLPGIVYTLHGIATISFPGAAARSVGQGEAVFLPALVVHTHDNAEGQVGAGALAAGLILVVIILCAVTWLRGGRRRAIVAMLSLLLIGGGALALIGGRSNDWYFIAVRPEGARSDPMPRPDGRVTFSSPDLDPVPAAPYTETLTAITVPPGARYDALDVSGPETIIVLEGSAALHVGDEDRQLDAGHATFAQAGQKVVIVNPGSDTLQVLAFAVTTQSP
jgi:quercetin dioxygenase-like cupin family protein